MRTFGGTVPIRRHRPAQRSGTYEDGPKATGALAPAPSGPFRRTVPHRQGVPQRATATAWTHSPAERRPRQLNGPARPEPPGPLNGGRPMAPLYPVWPAASSVPIPSVNHRRAPVKGAGEVILARCQEQGFEVMSWSAHSVGVYRSELSFAVRYSGDGVDHRERPHAWGSR